MIRARIPDHQQFKVAKKTENGTEKQSEQQSDKKMDKQQDLSDSSMDDMDLSPLEDSGEVELLAELADPTGLTSAEDPEEESEEDLQDLHLQGEKRVAAKKGAIPALAERNRP